MLLDDLATLIEGGAIATSGTDLFAGGLPDTPDAAVAMMETAGREGKHVFGQALPAIEYPRVRIAARGEPNDYETPRGTIEAIYQLLVARSAETVSGGARYLTWEPIQPPYSLGKDKNERWIVGFNVEVYKEVSAL
jgi:hypothetical protein